MTGAPKRVVFCADDFGQSRPIDSGILGLVAQGRLTAVSCLVQGAGWESDAPQLLPHADGVDIGLHFNLTHPFPGGGAMSHRALIARSYLGLLDLAALARTLNAQLDAFERVAGRAPDFVDGHQHVHQLPGVRSVLVDTLTRRYFAPPYVRVTVPARSRGLKAFMIASLGGHALRRELQSRGVPHNPDFAGVYRLEPDQGYGKRMDAWLATVEDGCIIMCHPGAPDVTPHDPIAAARAVELTYLASPEFGSACARAGVTPSRFVGARR